MWPTVDGEIVCTTGQGVAWHGGRVAYFKDICGGLEEFKAADEGLVCGLTNALLDCLRRNPDLVRFLTEVER